MGQQISVGQVGHSRVSTRDSLGLPTVFGLAVKCATARLSTLTGLISCTKLGTNAGGVRN